MKGDGDARENGGCDGLPAPAWSPLATVDRDGLVERTIYGAIAWVQDGTLIHGLAAEGRCYGRSLLKPLMMRVFADALTPLLSGPQRALSVASHNGTTAHIAMARSILTEAESAFIRTPCAGALVPDPIHPLAPSPWVHCCSGEHAAILKGCAALGWPLDGYLSQAHPSFSAFIEVLRAVLGPEWTPEKTATDGCGLTTIGHSIAELAHLYASLSTRWNDDWIASAMVGNPLLIGGEGRLDTTILQRGGGQVLAKEGADGLLGLALHPEFNAGAGLGIAVKIAHGWDPEATAWVADGIFEALGLELRVGKTPGGQHIRLHPQLCPPTLRLGDRP